MADFKKLGAGVQIFEPTVILRPEVISIGDGSRVDSFCKLEGGVGIEIGRQVHLASFTHVNVGGGMVIIGDEAGTSSGVKICGGMVDLSYPAGSPVADPGRSGAVRKVTTIGARAILFANAVVLPGVTIGDEAVIAAGSVVTRDVPAGEVWAGVPARFLRKR